MSRSCQNLPYSADWQAGHAAFQSAKNGKCCQYPCNNFMVKIGFAKIYLFNTIIMNSSILSET